MRKFRKLHTGEVLMLAAYAVLLASVFLVEEGAGEDLNFFTFIAMVALSFWNVWRHRAISPVLYPFYILIGVALGAVLVLFAGSSNAPAAIGAGLFFIFFVLAFLELLWGLIFAIKGVYKILILMVLSFLVVLMLAMIFNSPGERDGKGSTLYPDEYSQLASS